MKTEYDNIRVQARAAAELLSAIARHVESRSYRGGLNPAQWAALRYFAGANPSARTPSGFARNHHSTRGTAWSTVVALERKGLLVRRADAEDRRRVRFDLTEPGRAALADDPFEALSRAITELPAEDRERLHGALAALGRQLLIHDPAS